MTPKSDLIQEYIYKAQKELAQKVWNGVEFILRNQIDNPIEGDITLEKLRERHIISFVYDKVLPPPRIKVDEKNIYCEIDSDFLGVRQGGYIITLNGNRIGIDTYILENTRQEYIDYSRVNTEKN